MGHSGTDKGPGRIAVSMECRDRGGAAAHASLKSWALAYQAGLTLAATMSKTFTMLLRLKAGACRSMLRKTHMFSWMNNHSVAEASMNAAVQNV